MDNSVIVDAQPSYAAEQQVDVFSSCSSPKNRLELKRLRD